MPDPFPFARRTDWQLLTNPLSLALEELRDKKNLILDLTESNPTRCGFRYPEEKILSALSDKKNLEYSPNPQGFLEVRRVISGYYQAKQITVDPKQIFLTASTSEAYSYLFRLLLNPNEKVLIPQPSYPLFQYLIELNDARMEFYPLIYDQSQENWHVDLNALKNLFSSAVRVLILVNPNNPTGSFITRKEFLQIQEMCALYQVAIISDEVFLDYAFESNPNRVETVVEQNKVLSFSLGGISKSLALPQMKLSWITLSGPPKLIESASQRLEIIADTYLSTNAPVQNALAQWSEYKDDIQNEIKGRLYKNWQGLKQILQTFPQKKCQCLNAQGGWYVILKFSLGNRTEEQWVMDFLTKDHVFIHPGYFFDFSEEGFLVLSLLPEPKIFQEAVLRILNRINHSD